MMGHRFLNAGMRGFAPVLAHDEWQAPPPIPIVRDGIVMMRALQAEFSAVGREERECCIVVSRPDAIEGVSETEVIGAVGNRFSRCLRPYDGLFAFGPDRYLISLPHIKSEDTVTVMNRLRGQIAEAPLEVASGSAVAVTISLGGAMLDPAVSLQENIDRADQALFEAWREGGDGVCLWSPELDAP